MNKYLDCIKHIMEIANSFLLENSNLHYSEISKGVRDYALDIDLELEKKYSEYLKDMFPDIPIMGEELSPEVISSNYQGKYWAIDPIDGTVNYSRNLPEYGSSLALVQNGIPIACGLCFPHLNEIYTATHEGGAFLNGKRINVSPTQTENRAIAAYGDFSIGDNYELKNQIKAKYIEKLANKVLRVRMPGTAALQLAWVASGKIDISITFGNKPWDVQGGVLLVKEAGGLVFDFNGKDHTTNSKYTLATNNNNFKSFVMDLFDYNL